MSTSALGFEQQWKVKDADYLEIEENITLITLKVSIVFSHDYGINLMYGIYTTLFVGNQKAWTPDRVTIITCPPVILVLVTTSLPPTRTFTLTSTSDRIKQCRPQNLIFFRIGFSSDGLILPWYMKCMCTEAQYHIPNPSILPKNFCRFIWKSWTLLKKP